MICQDPLLHCPIGHVFEHILGGCKATTSIFQVVYNVEFRVQVGGKGSCACCSRSDHWNSSVSFRTCDKMPAYATFTSHISVVSGFYNLRCTPGRASSVLSVKCTLKSTSRHKRK